MNYVRLAVIVGISSLFLAAAPARSQQASGGKVANSTVGQVGQRQTHGQPLAGIEPLARIDSRIENRVQSRIRNRIDQYYDPQANARSPFEVAGDKVRAAGHPALR